METDKNQANTILEKGVKKIDSLYEKLPIDDLNKKLNEKNINIDLRCPAAKITVGIIIIAVIIIIAKLIFGGDSIPQQSTVDRMITEKREQLGIEKVVSISYENVGIEQGFDNVQNTNVTTYTIESEIDLINLTNKGYDFDGFYLNNKKAAEIYMTPIEKGNAE